MVPQFLPWAAQVVGVHSDWQVPATQISRGGHRWPQAPQSLRVVRSVHFPRQQPCPAAQFPQVPPQPSSPQFLPVQRGVQVLAHSPLRQVRSLQQPGLPGPQARPALVQDAASAARRPSVAATPPTSARSSSRRE
jgi:hypothetical protein